MKLKKLVASMAVAGLTFAASSAHALIVQDGWGMSTPTSNNTNIGHLNLSGGVATVIQQVGLDGNPFAGAKFTEFGAIYTISYTAENVTGFNDFGAPNLFNNGLSLKIEFMNFSGTVTDYNVATGKLSYLFNPGGTILVSAGATQLAALSVADAADGLSGGDINNFFGVAQTNGQSTLLANFDAFLNGFGISIDAPGYSDVSDLYLQIQTTNKIGRPVSAVGACQFGQCREIMITSDGSADLLKVPEPGTLALAGLGLLGFGVSRRRAK